MDSHFIKYETGNCGIPGRSGQTMWAEIRIAEVENGSVECIEKKAREIKEHAECCSLWVEFIGVTRGEPVDFCGLDGFDVPRPKQEVKDVAA